MSDQERHTIRNLAAGAQMGAQRLAQVEPELSELIIALARAVSMLCDEVGEAQREARYASNTAQAASGRTS